MNSSSLLELESIEKGLNIFLNRAVVVAKNVLAPFLVGTATQIPSY